MTSDLVKSAVFGKECTKSSFFTKRSTYYYILPPLPALPPSFLGRGRGHYDVAERRQYEVDTVSLSSWHVNEYRVARLQDDWAGQFHDGDAYVFRWVYKVSLTGRDLKGRPSRHAAVGRERCAYFFWQGRGSG